MFFVVLYEQKRLISINKKCLLRVQLTIFFHNGITCWSVWSIKYQESTKIFYAMRCLYLCTYSFLLSFFFLCKISEKVKNAPHDFLQPKTTSTGRLFCPNKNPTPNDILFKITLTHLLWSRRFCTKACHAKSDLQLRTCDFCLQVLVQL